MGGWTGQGRVGPSLRDKRARSNLDTHTPYDTSCETERIKQDKALPNLGKEYSCSDNNQESLKFIFSMDYARVTLATGQG